MDWCLIYRLPTIKLATCGRLNSGLVLVLRQLCESSTGLLHSKDVLSTKMIILDYHRTSLYQRRSCCSTNVQCVLPYHCRSLLLSCLR